MSHRALDVPAKGERHMADTRRIAGSPSMGRPTCWSTTRASRATACAEAGIHGFATGADFSLNGGLHMS